MARVIGKRYELDELIGRGGMGEVWSGWDMVLDRPIAVKLIPPLAAGDDEPEAVARFQREARVTARLRHPGVPQVFDADLDTGAGRMYLVMELVDGVPLTAYTAASGGLPIEWAAAICAQIATVLSHAHAASVVHRDLKPDNVLLAGDGTVKVLDFGIAALLGDRMKLTRTGQLIGTCMYMAPEQIRGGQISPKTDLYALGCIAFELLAGRPVFAEPIEARQLHHHEFTVPEPLTVVRLGTPEALSALVAKLLAKHPERRPENATEVYERLLGFLPASGAAATEPPSGLDRAADPTRVFRMPYAPKAPEPTVRRRENARPEKPADLPTVLSRSVELAREHMFGLLDDGRFDQAASVLGKAIAAATAAVGAAHPRVLDLRMEHAAVLYLAEDHGTALREFVSLADVFGSGPDPKRLASECRLQAAHCRAALGQGTVALREFGALLDEERGTGGDTSERAMEIRRAVIALLAAEGRGAEASSSVESFAHDAVFVYPPGHEMRHWAEGMRDNLSVPEE
nr:serine/threonine-protein kinase [Glycomyces sp. NRRL B-16210]